MKKITAFCLLLIIYENAFSQPESIGKYQKGKDKDGLLIFKIKGRKYKTDFSSFVHHSDTIYNNIDTADIPTHIMIYNVRYLFIGSYPGTDIRSSFDYADRRLFRLEVIDLKNPLKKWQYDFEGKTSLKQIIFFNKNDGIITYNGNLKKIPIGTAEISGINTGINID